MIRNSKNNSVSISIFLSYKVSPTLGFIVNTLGAWSSFEPWKTELQSLLPKCNSTEESLREELRARQILQWLYTELIRLSCEFVVESRVLEGKQLDRTWIAAEIERLRHLEVHGSDGIIKVFAIGSELFDVLRKGGGQPHDIVYSWYRDGGWPARNAFDVILKRSSEECAAIVAREAMAILSSCVGIGQNITGKKAESLFTIFARSVWVSALALVSRMAEKEAL